MLTVSDVATRMNVTRAVAYGLIHLLEKKGMLTPVSKKVNQGKGKPASLYQFNETHATACAELVRSLIQAEQAVETASAVQAETPAEQAVESAATF